MQFMIFSITSAIRSFLWPVIVLVLFGCAHELPVYPVSPPGFLLKTELAPDTLEIYGNDISIQIGQVKLIEGDKSSPEQALVQVPFRVINDGRSPILLMPREFLLTVDDEAIPVWPYLTFINPPGSAAEVSDADEVLILPGAVFWMVAKLKPCPPRIACKIASDLQGAIRKISRGVTLHFQIIQSGHTRQTVSLWARFTSRNWDIWWHKLRHGFAS